MPGWPPNPCKLPVAPCRFVTHGVVPAGTTLKLAKAG